MSFLVCEKHRKVEKVAAKIATNAYLCLNRYCPDSFKIFCATCKNDHRDHAIKILTLEDTAFLVDRLIKTPFKEVTKYMSEALDVMKKLKLIKQFRKKIDVLERQVQKEALQLIDFTQSLIHEYAICKQNVNGLSQMLNSIEEPKIYADFLKNSQELLRNVDYNYKKDKFEYGNALIKEKEDKRRKSIENGKRKIEEVKDYSMKIIEVILHNDDTDSEEEDLMSKKKHYELLKEELSLEKDGDQVKSEITDHMKNSKSTTKTIHQKVESSLIENQTQTEQQLLEKSQAQINANKLLEQIKQTSIKSETELKNRILVLGKDKENLNKEIKKWRDKFDQKNKKILDIENKLKVNKEARLQQEKQKDQMFYKIVNLSQWRGLTELDRNE